MRQSPYEQMKRFTERVLHPYPEPRFAAPDFVQLALMSSSAGSRRRREFDSSAPRGVTAGPSATVGTAIPPQPVQLREVFPTPPGTTWGDITIRMLDGETVVIVIREVRTIRSFANMGMMNKKNGKPTVQWGLLRSFADERGSLTWKNRAADRRNQKRCENLAKNLRAYFGLDQDPFVYDRVSKGWKSRFQLLPDS